MPVRRSKEVVETEKREASDKMNKEREQMQPYAGETEDYAKLATNNPDKGQADDGPMTSDEVAARGAGNNRPLPDDH
jgi:hypothetical protein